MNQGQFLTPEGAEDVRRELDELINVKRPEIARRLKEAREMGDLSENADYIDAKEQQGFIEGRIQQLEYLLRHAKIVAKVTTDEVRFGSTVTVQEPGYDPEDYTIVGPAEASPREGKISNESPIGSALLGHRVGDKVNVQTPGGKITFKILEIS